MRILMTAPDHLMIDRRIIQEATSLIRSGHNVKLLAGFECAKRESFVLEGITVERFVYDWQDTRFQGYVERFGLVPGTKLYSLAHRTFQKWAADYSKLNSFDQFIVERMCECEADIVHVHDFPMLPAAVEFAKLRKIPLIYDAHEIYYAQVQLPAEIQAKYRAQEAQLTPACDAVITVNPYLARIMAKRYHIREPDVVMNASPLNPIAATKILRERFNLPVDARIVLYQGWISDNRGIDRLVEATATFRPNIYTVIVGYGDYEARLKELVAEKGLGDRVLFFGGVPSEKLHEITCDADLGIIPYYGVDENNYHCSPNKLFEFSVAALPFMANDLPFLRDIAAQYGGGMLTDLGTADSVATAVNTVFSSEATLAALKQGALKARDALNWETEEKVLYGIYDRVVGAKARH